MTTVLACFAYKKHSRELQQELSCPSTGPLLASTFCQAPLFIRTNKVLTEKVLYCSVELERQASEYDALAPFDIEVFPLQIAPLGY